MQGQVDVLEGKAKVLARYRDGASRIADQLDALAQGEPIDAEAPDRETASSATAWGGRGGAAAAAPDADDVHDLPPAVSRMVLSAQEDLRREIARQMHDGPAQSLTNIVLQAQIVDRLLARDPAAAAAEVRQLIVMVQATLDATKSFIFDVRPMVLDDLGLLPTIRRAAREWGRRSRIPVELESFGTDRRLTMELESGLFRIIDDAVGGFLSGRPERITIRMDWTDGLEARVTAHRAAGQSAESGARPSAASAADDAARAEQSRGRGKGKGAAVAGQSDAMPAALAAMIEDRTAEDTAARHAVGALPVAVRREIRQRAATLGVELDLPEDRLEVVVVVPGDGDA
jgi:hypothetical protein